MCSPLPARFDAGGLSAYEHMLTLQEVEAEAKRYRFFAQGHGMRSGAAYLRVDPPQPSTSAPADHSSELVSQSSLHPADLSIPEQFAADLAPAADRSKPEDQLEAALPANNSEQARAGQGGVKIDCLLCTCRRQEAVGMHDPDKLQVVMRQLLGITPPAPEPALISKDVWY